MTICIITDRAILLDKHVWHCHISNMILVDTSGQHQSLPEAWKTLFVEFKETVSSSSGFKALR